MNSVTRQTTTTGNELGGLPCHKIQSEHLERLAVVYVRQSSPRQVIEIGPRKL